MTSTATGGGQPGPVTRAIGKGRAAGIYGAVVTAAVLDAAGNRLPTAALVVAVVVTLVVYWLAEQYAELLGMIALKDLVLLHLH